MTNGRTVESCPMRRTLRPCAPCRLDVPRSTPNCNAAPPDACELTRKNNDSAPVPSTQPHHCRPLWRDRGAGRSEEHTSELQSHSDLVCRLLLEKKNKKSST